MEDQAPDHNNRNNHPSQGSNKSEPVRSRWTPKPEQILILESIFNSGMVNPPKDETVRIRKLLEKFGAVGDANVFYWFQNRRSRSRRRQRGGGIGDNACVDDLFSFSQQMGLSEIDQSSILCSSNTTNLHFQTGFITVFINGVPTEVPNGPLDMKSMFGQDAMLVHSSGVPVPFNEYGFSLQSLQMGESYFLVSRSL
ncbi:hypothetical protein C5167_003344 [Papaver somniferum]|uniref:Homeobox domain-containing protein n=1 Tax=Papaver somniferum TaxID=3469 RepID=A0A4Y7L1Q7_PAPSO|nr:hypothetical protein C5167_003344 [Papaver somniferum]